MRKGLTRLADKDRKKIISDYINSQNYSEAARLNEVSVDTVRRLVREDKNFSKNLQEKKEENTLTTLEYMETQHQTKKRILDKLLRGIEIKAEDINMLTNVKDLATAYGIILDKELKVLELKRGMGNKEDLKKVEELLDKLNIEAYNDTK